MAILPTFVFIALVVSFFLTPVLPFTPLLRQLGIIAEPHVVIAHCASIAEVNQIAAMLEEQLKGTNLDGEIIDGQIYASSEATCRDPEALAAYGKLVYGGTVIVAIPDTTDKLNKVVIRLVPRHPANSTILPLPETLVLKPLTYDDPSFGTVLATYTSSANVIRLLHENDYQHAWDAFRQLQGGAHVSKDVQEYVRQVTNLEGDPVLGYARMVACTLSSWLNECWPDEEKTRESQLENYTIAEFDKDKYGQEEMNALYRAGMYVGLVDRPMGTVDKTSIGEQATMDQTLRQAHTQLCRPDSDPRSFNIALFCKSYDTSLKRNELAQFEVLRSHLAALQIERWLATHRVNYVIDSHDNTPQSWYSAMQELLGTGPPPTKATRPLPLNTMQMCGNTSPGAADVLTLHAQFAQARVIRASIESQTALPNPPTQNYSNVIARLTCVLGIDNAHNPVLNELASLDAPEISQDKKNSLAEELSKRLTDSVNGPPGPKVNWWLPQPGVIPNAYTPVAFLVAWNNERLLELPRYDLQLHWPDTNPGSADGPLFYTQPITPVQTANNQLVYNFSVPMTYNDTAPDQPDRDSLFTIDDPKNDLADPCSNEKSVQLPQEVSIKQLPKLIARRTLCVSLAQNEEQRERILYDLPSNNLATLTLDGSVQFNRYDPFANFPADRHPPGWLLLLPPKPQAIEQPTEQPTKQLLAENVSFFDEEGYHYTCTYFGENLNCQATILIQLTVPDPSNPNASLTATTENLRNLLSKGLDVTPTFKDVTVSSAQADALLVAARYKSVNKDDQSTEDPFQPSLLVQLSWSQPERRPQDLTLQFNLTTPDQKRSLDCGTGRCDLTLSLVPGDIIPNTQTPIDETE